MGQYVDKVASKVQKGVIWRHLRLLIEGTERARAVSSSMGECPRAIDCFTGNILTRDALVRVNLGVVVALRSL